VETFQIILAGGGEVMDETTDLMEINKAGKCRTFITKWNITLKESIEESNM
jgi:hypothetical protein